LDDEAIGELVKRLPQAFGNSVDENLEPKLAWRKARLELDDNSLSKLVKTLPPVLNLSIDDNLEPKLAWLKARLGLDDASLSVLVQRMPSNLGCSVETNLEATIKFYEECVGLDAARTLIANDPRLLGSSLEKRLKPRHAECQEAGIPIDEGAVERMAMH
jgi:hypothetical protein